MLESLTIRKAAEKAQVNLKTAFLWRHRFSEWLYNDKPDELGGIVEADETYYRVSKKGCRNLNRKPHKRGRDNVKRGISKDKVCVFTACDRSQHSIEAVAGRGPIQGKWLEDKFAKSIAEDAVLVTDGHNSYNYFCNKTKTTHVIVKNSKGLRTSKSYHIQHINGYHGRLRNWIIGKFHGVATKYLKHYLSWRHELEKKVKVTNTELFLLASRQNTPLTGT